MIPFEQGKDFLVAVQNRYQLNQSIEVNGMRGRVVEQITHDDYTAVWAFRGFPSEAISLNPRFYYRCEFTEPLAASVPGKSDSVESAADAV